MNIVKSKKNTIQSTDSEDFNKQVKFFNELGWELMDNGIKIIKKDDGTVYYQDFIHKNYVIEFFDNGNIQSVVFIDEWDQMDGICIVLYENGQKRVEVFYNYGKPEGLLTEWYDSGQKQSEFNYENGEKNGPYIHWYENGQKKYEGIFEKDKKVGLRTEWYENGQKSLEGTYKDGRLWGYDEWYEDGSVKK